jgi:NIMA (never in mitosis gene a)-related kinase
MQKYEIVKNLGKGAYGRVDLAKIKAKGELVAIKKVKFGTMSVKERAKAGEEVRFLSSLHHPNIVGYRDSFIERNSLYIVMEYIDGGDLEKRIRQRGISSFTETEVLFTFVQILLALAYLHERRILHRDLKPQNIFLTNHGIVKLGDLGVAKSLDGTGDLAKTLIGTPFYLAPEIWDQKPYDMAADIWSLGTLLYELCALKKPYEGENSQGLFVAVMKRTRAPIPDFYSPELRQLVDGMLSHEPQRRPTAEQVKNLPFIRQAIQNLIAHNHNQIAKAPAIAPAKSGRPTKAGRQRLLAPVVVSPNLVTIRDEEPGNKAGGMEFEDDFIEPEEENVIEDDFIEDENDDDPFTLLQTVTSVLEDSMTKQKHQIDTWKYVAPDQQFVRTNDVIVPGYIRETTPYNVESLRVKLEKELGDDNLGQLYRHLQSPGNPASARYVREYEKKNPKAVREVKNLLQLEENL